MEGDNRLFDWFSHAARSHLVDKRYFTPSPASDWRAGRIQKENTEKEKGYLQAVLRICEEEKIDTIFPSFDPHVYVLSKNKWTFKRLGITLPVPDFDVVITPLDKYRTIKAAEELGFSCPKTRLPESEDDLQRIADEIGFPILIKPRFTASGRGTTAVRNFSELSETIRLISKGCGMPLLQEFIPGDQGDYITLCCLQRILCTHLLRIDGRSSRSRSNPGSQSGNTYNAAVGGTRDIADAGATEPAAEALAPFPKATLSVARRPAGKNHRRCCRCPSQFSFFQTALQSHARSLLLTDKFGHVDEILVCPHQFCTLERCPYNSTLSNKTPKCLFNVHRSAEVFLGTNLALRVF